MGETTKQPAVFCISWRIIVFVFLCILSRLWFLQIVRGNEYLVYSEHNSQRKLPLPAPRGLILDSGGKVLVANRMAHSLQIIPEDVTAKSIKGLQKIFGSDLEIEEKIREHLNKGGLSSTPFTLLQDLPPDLTLKVEEAMPELPGVRIRSVFVRYYPYRDYGAHLFGYLGQINREQLEEQRKKGLNYRYDDVIGITGLEHVYESYLKGVDGSEVYEVNVNKQNLRLLEEIPPSPGHNLRLTIDFETQLAADQSVREHLRYLRESLHKRDAKSAAVVALDPTDGRILAMTSYPSFDPNNFVSRVPQDWYRNMITNPDRPFLNRVIQAYPPGSTFKPVAALAALAEGKVDLKEAFFCNGYDPVYGLKKKCWTFSQGRPPHGRENIVDGLKNSCNVVFYELGRRLGIDKLAEYARLFGFGEPTGFEFYPGEKSGLIPDREFKKNNYRRPDMQIWYPIETLDVAIGQGAVSATPFQIAQLFMAIANRGKIYRPYVVSEIIHPDGKTRQKFSSRLSRDIKLPEKDWEIVEEGLMAVTGEGGTAAEAFANAPYHAAGKTGTAQTTGKSHGWFVGYAPVENPRILVVVLVEHGESGSAAAAPIGRKVMDAYLRVSPPEPSKSPEKKSKKPVASPSPGAQAPETEPLSPPPPVSPACSPEHSPADPPLASPEVRVQPQPSPDQAEGLE